MHNPYTIPVWKKAPFIRLMLPLVTGVLLQWNLQIKLPLITIASVCFVIAYCLFLLFPLAIRFRLKFVQGFLLNLLLICLGLLITLRKDIRNSNDWYGNVYKAGDRVVIRVNEPLIEKLNSFKVEGFVEAVIQDDSVINCRGKILLYIAKDSSAGTTKKIPAQLQFGDIILVNKALQRIKNSGNPGAFNYERYAAFQQIFHQVFLKEADWVKGPNKNVNSFQQFIFTTKESILTILSKYIVSGKDELGIAEALLIGYTNDLDKDLVQAYSNTGVVHIIAISGMHLGLIYMLLVWLFAKIPFIKHSKTVQLLLILTCLWMFSFLTGAAASVLRSAVMFTFIAVGKNIARQSSIFNSLAASAFVMLCFNPYYLWDVGFQLSYTAVTGIVIFQKPVFNWFYFKLKWINEIWKMVAVSLSAQVLTFPICIYYFHQFPNFFLVTNIIAVPLSSVILFGEIALVAFNHIPFIGVFLGKIIGGLLWAMNKTILWISNLPFAVWDEIHSSVASTIFLYFIVICLSTWLLYKNKIPFRLTIIGFLFFSILQAFQNWEISKQQKIIIYNVPRHRAIDFVVGNNYRFVGDSILLTSGALQNFHLKPARIELQIQKKVDAMPAFFQELQFYQLGNKKVLLIDQPLQFEPVQQKIDVDMIIISKNPKLYIARLARVFNCAQYVFDASNSLWKIDQWQKESKELLLNCYSIPASGAFVYDIGM